MGLRLTIIAIMIGASSHTIKCGHRDSLLFYILLNKKKPTALSLRARYASASFVVTCVPRIVSRSLRGLFLRKLFVNCLSAWHYNFTRCKRRAFNTTDTELNAIAAPATHGASRPIAAIGIPNVL